MVGMRKDKREDDRQGGAAVASRSATTTLARLLDALDLSDLDLMTIGDLARCGPDPEDECLLAMLALLFAALGEGSLCLPLEEDHLNAAMRLSGDAAAGERVSGFLRHLEDGRYDGLIDRTAGGSFKPLVIDGAGGRRRIYFQKFHYHEQRLKARLRSFIALPMDHYPPAETVQAVIEALYSDAAVIRKGAGGDPVVMDPLQVNAIRAALTAPLLILSGGPGTGKTSLLVNMLRAMVRTGTDPARILLAAPTGRAAQRMTEALTANLATISAPDSGDRHLARLSGSTLHKLLVFRSRGGGFLYGERRPIPADVIAVDEVSMVDVVMMDRLFQAVDPRRTRVILIGDKDQLPSVEAGSVLADLDPASGGAFADHFVELRTVYRAGGQLLDLSQQINAGRSVALKPVDFEQALTLESGGWAFVKAGDWNAMQRHLDHWAMHQYVQAKTGAGAAYADRVQQLDRMGAANRTGEADARAAQIDRLFDFVYRCRILTVLRHGRTGAQWINDRIAGGLKRILDPGGPPDSRLFNGALIMITRNDYSRHLFNGDVGVVLLQRDTGIYQAYFKRSGTIMTFPAAGLPDWELAFAMTVHKSQGSEFEDTLLVLPEDPGHRLLTREIIYTAATRASRRLIVYGTAGAFHTALKRKIQRQSGLVGLGLSGRAFH